jgi:hypothetical protein
MDDLNLDIRNYTIEDLEGLFSLNTFEKYRREDIEKKELDLINKTISVSNKETKKQMLDFIKTAKEILIKEKCKPDKANSDKVMPKQKEDTGYFTGTFNPIEKRIVNKTLCVDTLFRSNYFNTNASDFVYSLPEPITDVVSIQVAACEIAYMWHFVSEERKNNTFIVRITNAISGVFGPDEGTIKFKPDTSFDKRKFTSHKFTIKIPDGNYLSDNFINTINNTFWNTIVDDSGNETNALSYIRCEILPTNAKTIFRANTLYDPLHNSMKPPAPYDTYDEKYYSENFSFSIDFRNSDEPTRPIYRNLGWNLGFRKEYYNVDKNSVYFSPNSQVVLYKSTADTNKNTNYVTNKGYLSSESSYGCLHDNYIYLEIDDYHNNFASDIVVAMDNNSSYLGKNTMARIQLRSNFYTIICENGSDKTFKKREYYGPIKLEKLNIRLLDRFGKPLSLAQNDYSFVLDIKQYK